jgi:type VI secretion system protein ImpC
MPGRLQFTLETGRPAGAAHHGRGPMRLLVVGDFSARPAAERRPLAERPTHRVDVDTLDEVIARLAPRLLTTAGSVDFTQLDDFHPDALYQRLPLFDALRHSRTRPPEQAADLLGALLGQGAPSAAGAPRSAAPATGIEALLQRVVAPHIVPDTRAQTQAYLSAVDSAIAEQMRALLHDPAFQALEAAWRGVQWLIGSLELGDDLQLHLFDASRDELLADVVASQGRLAETELHRALADRWRGVPGGEPWHLLAGLYRFGPSDADNGLLAALGLVASQAGGPFIAEGDRTLAGPPDDPGLAAWRSLRGSEAAPWIGLAAPRVLLRVPYGKAHDPVVSFAFEEFDGAPAHEHFLWGNPALAVALLTGRAFTLNGWDFEPGDEREIGDLPAYAFTQDGERELQASAEQYLGEEGGNALLQAGLMPVLSHQHRNAVTVMRMQSIATPAARLAGTWAADAR